jgi:hypothetical protein
MADSRGNRAMQFLRDKCPALVRAIHPRTCAVAFLAVLYTPIFASGDVP